MTLRLLPLFRSSATFWGTTYTFEPGFFDEFLFRRFGDPPVNANVLVDADRLSALWDEWADEPWRFRRVNRDYLVRPVHWHGRSFHPKTYLIGDKGGGTLLVGSGNLGLRGIVQGNEVFSVFESSTAVGRAAIATWRTWMQKLIVGLEDHTVAYRWNEFLRTASWLPTLDAESPLVHNLDRPIIDQIAERIAAPVEQLHVLAPFFDADLHALRELMRTLQPRSITIYLPRGINIDGPLLADLLAEMDVPVSLLGYNNPGFVHAKLIGVISDDRGILVSGSPNCSRSALTLPADVGNCEVAVVTEAAADAVRGAFIRHGWALEARDAADLAGLSYRSEPDKPGGWPVHLRSAVRTDDGWIEVAYRTTGDAEPAMLSTSGEKAALVGARTTNAWPADTPLGAVWLLDGSGKRISNAVPVDLPRQLTSWLAERADTENRLRELRREDLETGIGRLLEDLNRECIFDLDDTPAMRAADRATDSAEGGEDDASEFWDRFRADQLRLDYRVARYQRLLAIGPGGVADNDELYGLLASMLHRVPDDALRLLATAQTSDERRATQPARPQLQVRVGNVLSRWSKALNDRRFMWISPFVPIVNYDHLLKAIAICWWDGYVNRDRLKVILLELLQSFVGTEKRKGYLLTLAEDARLRAMDKLSAESRELAAALVYASVSPDGNWKATVYEWQPVLERAMDLYVVETGPSTIGWIEQLLKGHQRDGAIERSRTPTLRDVDDHLVRLVFHIDDKHWCQVQQLELGLTKIELLPSEKHLQRAYPVTIGVHGVTDLVDDPRIVSLLRRVFKYKKVAGAVVVAKSGTGAKLQSLSVDATGSVSWTTGRGFVERDYVLSDDRLAKLERLERGLEAVLLSDRHDDSGSVVG